MLEFTLFNSNVLSVCLSASTLVSVNDVMFRVVLVLPSQLSQWILFRKIQLCDAWQGCICILRTKLSLARKNLSTEVRFTIV